MTVEFVELDWRGQRVCIEHEWVGAGGADGDGPVLIFLHEGLGSRAMWRDFPARLCAAAGVRGLVYSRPGYGRSTPPPVADEWDVDYMHRQALELLPALRQSLKLDDEPPWLFGHSDGGSIALLHAARFPVRGAIVLAPHILVEDVSVRSIEQARVAFETTDLPQRLGRHHDDPQGVFRRWNRIWLSPAFRAWNIEQQIGTIACPLLAIQGLDDEYGTPEQIHGITRRVPQTQELLLAGCRHSAHKDQPEAVIEAAVSFLRRH